MNSYYLSILYHWLFLTVMLFAEVREYKTKRGRKERKKKEKVDHSQQLYQNEKFADVFSNNDLGRESCTSQKNIFDELFYYKCEKRTQKP